MGKDRLKPKHTKYEKILDNDMTAKLYIGFYQKIVIPKNFNNLSQKERSKIINEYFDQINKVKPVGWEMSNIHIRTEDGKVERLI